jgi:MYXO-CTERM domain-containing protein
MAVDPVSLLIPLAGILAAVFLAAALARRRRGE